MTPEERARLLCIRIRSAISARLKDTLLGPHRDGLCANCHDIAAEIRAAIKDAEVSRGR